MYSTHDRVEYTVSKLTEAMEGKSRGRISYLLLENLMRVEKVPAFLFLELQQCLVIEGFALHEFTGRGGYGILRLSSLEAAKPLTIAGTAS
jgi:hypothetical protein